MSKVGVFLDRDGTICRDIHYLSHAAMFELLPKVAEGIKLLNEFDVKIIVVTNQSGIARGYFSEQDLKSIHQVMIAELSRKGAKVDAIYYCPHHPNNHCDCRKPKIGMLEKAKRDFALDLQRCFIIGDRKLDMQTGKNVSCKSILVPGPETEPDVDADYLATDFYDAAAYVLKNFRPQVFEKLIKL